MQDCRILPGYNLGWSYLAFYDPCSRSTTQGSIEQSSNYLPAWTPTPLSKKPRKAEERHAPSSKILDDLVSPSDSCGTQHGDRYSAQRLREPLHSSRTTSRTMVRDERTTLSRAQPQEARNCRHPTTTPAHNQSLKTCRRNGGLINFTA